VIGADGLRSIVARRLGRRRYGAPRRVAFVAHVEGVRGVGATAELHVGRTGYVGLNPIGGDVTNVALVVPRKAAADARGDARGFFYQMIECFPAVAGRVDGRREVRPVLATGPFAARSGRIIAPGALLLGDAAEFFDPFTGEGIYRALRGAELAAEAAIPALAAGRRVSEADLRPYITARRQAFAGGQAVERIIGWLMFAPAIFDRAVRRLAHHGLADRLIGVTGDLRPAADALNPAFLLRALL
jgi:flavin-dependent dehydrogenase